MKTVDLKDVELLEDFMTAPYNPEPFDDASISVIFVNHFKLPWNSEVDVVDTHNTMKDYIKKNGGTAFSYEWEILDNVLCVDGKMLKRVGPSNCQYVENPMADYWEGRCLDKKDWD